MVKAHLCNKNYFWILVTTKLYQLTLSFCFTNSLTIDHGPIIIMINYVVAFFFYYFLTSLGEGEIGQLLAGLGGSHRRIGHREVTLTMSGQF